MEHFDIETEQAGDTLLVHLVGEAGHAEERVFRTDLLAALDSSPGPIVVDLNRLSFIDSTGLSVLIAGYQHASELGLAFSLAAPQPHVARRLRTTGLDSLFPVHPTVTEALAQPDLTSKGLD